MARLEAWELIESLAVSNQRKPYQRTWAGAAVL